MNYLIKNTSALHDHRVSIDLGRPKMQDYAFDTYNYRTLISVQIMILCDL